MEFKVFLLCFAFVIVATSAASLCKCGAEKEDPVSKYKLKVKDGDEEIEEEVEIDTEKQTETIHVPKTSSSSSAADIVYDFKRNVAMHRVSAAKACFLSNGTENLPKPDDLKKALDEHNAQKGDRQGNSTISNEYHVVSTVSDRSDLSDEMAALCAKLPIYRVKKMKSQRVKRWPCYTVCIKVYLSCYRHYHSGYTWHWVCPWYWNCYIVC